MKPKRVLVIADLHCGHRSGLTPTQWQTKPCDEVPQRSKWAETQAAMWGWFTRTTTQMGRIDVCIVNGDAIDGKGARSEGCEQLTTDRDEQGDMAFNAIASVNAAAYVMVRGTPYHVGPGEDFENTIAKKLECKIGDHEWIDVNGLVLDCKHFVPGFSMPHTKATGILGDALWNAIWNDHDESQPRGDVFIRSHLHSYFDCVGMNPEQRCFITPALQGFGSRFGARQCRRVVNVGMLELNITSRKEWSWKVHLMSMKSQAASVLKM